MSTFAPVKEQLDLIIRGTDEVIPIEELEQKLTKSLETDQGKKMWDKRKTKMDKDVKRQVDRAMKNYNN